MTMMKTLTSNGHQAAEPSVYLSPEQGATLDGLIRDHPTATAHSIRAMFEELSGRRVAVTTVYVRKRKLGLPRSSPHGRHADAAAPLAPEFAAMQAIAAALTPFDKATAQRIINWADDWLEATNPEDEGTDH